MSEELFLRIVNSSAIGTTLLIIAVSLWIIASRMLEGKPLSLKSSAASSH